MKLHLDIQNSIKKQRLVYRPTMSLVFIKFFENIRWLAFLVVPLLLIFNYRNNIGISAYFALGVLILFFCIGLYFINLLYVIKGVSLTENRKRIIALLDDEFPEWNFSDNGQIIIRRTRKTGLFKWGAQLTVIFNDADILINLATLGRSDIKSPFHSLFNYLKIKRLSKSF